MLPIRGGVVLGTGITLLLFITGAGTVTKVCAATGATTMLVPSPFPYTTVSVCLL